MRFKWSVYLVVIPLLVSCGNKNDGGTRVSRGTGIAGFVNSNPNDSANCGGVQCGVIFGSNSTSFQQTIAEFLGADNTTLGTVSNRAGDSTGVRFSGHVATNSAIPCGTAAANASVNFSASNLNLMIFDSFAVSGQQQPIQFSFTRAIDANVQGSHFYITFEDDYGTFDLEGNIGPTTTTGYANFTYFDGSREVKGPLNVLQFTIPTRSFFSCQ